VLLYAVAAGVYAVDRVTKVLAETYLQDGPPVELIPGVLQLRFTTNPGGAFGLFGNLSLVFVLFSLAVIVIVVLASRSLSGRASSVALGLVLGGAAGNLTDRLVRGPGLGGEVVDFIDLHVWPVFNAADTAIVTGAALLLFLGIRRDRSQEEPP
jgi:signal peptidase II